MDYKTVLVHCDASNSAPHRLSVAVELARRFNAHLVGLYARPQFQPPMLFDGGFSMAPYLSAFEKSVTADRAAAHEAYTQAIAGADLSTEWKSVNGFVTAELVDAAHHADIVVVSQAEPNATQGIPVPQTLADDVALASPAPVMIVPHGGAPSNLGKNVLICWKKTHEASRAVAAALPILKAAENVMVLSATTGGQDKVPPAAELVKWLLRHGVKATVHYASVSDEDVGQLILSHAAQKEADLVVLGIYSHSRLRERVLGGVTRTLLAETTIPLLVAH